MGLFPTDSAAIYMQRIKPLSTIDFIGICGGEGLMSLLVSYPPLFDSAIPTS